MQDTVLLVAGAAVVALSAIAGLLGWITARRSMREHRSVMERAVRVKDEAAELLSQEVARLDDHILALRELDSIRFAQRYIDAKSGLEGRVNELRNSLAAAQRRRETLQRELDQLRADDGARGIEAARVRADLVRAQQEGYRLEQILESLSTVGPIPADHVRAELARRRELQVELQGRLNRLTLAGAARVSAVELLRADLERAVMEEQELERDLELAYSAAPLLDGLLGITADITDRLKDLQARLGGPLRILAESRRQPDRFGRVIGSARPRSKARLLEGGPSPAAVTEAGSGAAAAPAAVATPAEAASAAAELAVAAAPVEAAAASAALAANALAASAPAPATVPVGVVGNGAGA